MLSACELSASTIQLQSLKIINYTFLPWIKNSYKIDLLYELINRHYHLKLCQFLTTG